MSTVEMQLNRTVGEVKHIRQYLKSDDFKVEHVYAMATDFMWLKEAVVKSTTFHCHRWNIGV